jgi:hypothetical protein
MDKEPNTLRGLPSPDSLFDEVCTALDGKFKCCTRKEPNANQKWTTLLRERLAAIAQRHGLLQVVVPSDNTDARVELQWRRSDDANVVAGLGWEWEADGVAKLTKMANSDAPLKVYMTDCAGHKVQSRIKEVCTAIAKGRCTGNTLGIVFCAVDTKLRNTGKVCWAHKVVVWQQARLLEKRAT